MLFDKFIRKQRKTVYGIKLFLIGLFVIVGIGYVFHFIKEISGDVHAERYLSLGWNIEYDGQTYERKALADFSCKGIKRGDKVVMSRVLPPNIPLNAALIVHVHYAAVRVYIDDDLIYEADVDRFEQGKHLGNGFYEIVLPEGCTGKILTLEYIAGEDGAFSSIERPAVWDHYTFRQDYAAQNIVVLAFSMFFMVLGITMGVMAFAFEFRKVFAFLDIFRLAALGSFSLVFGMWIIAESDLFEIFTNDIITKSDMKYGAFFLMPVFFIGYHLENVGDAKLKYKNILFGLIMLMGTALYVFALIMHSLHEISFRTFLPVAHVIDVLTIFSVIMVKIYEYSKGLRHNSISFYATIIGTFSAIFDLIRYYIYSNTSAHGDSGFKISTMYVVMVFFVLALLFDYMQSTVRDAREDERMGTISKLAYTDVLTGLDNRQSAEKYFDTVDSKASPYVVVQFDLNNLKKVNDTYGHEEGDKYIELFAKTLRKMFENKGFVARTGGDEFVFVMIPKAEGERVWLENRLKDLNVILANKNTGHDEIRMSTAYGMYDSLFGDAKNIRDGLRYADAKMYEMKKEMKASR